MRTRPKIDLQRQEIAAYAGVTPALVSYYYPNKWDLFMSAAKPAIEIYTSETRSILGSGASLRSRLLSLINLTLRFNFDQGYLLDFYIESIQKTDKRKNVDELGKSTETIQVFFSELSRAGLIRGGNPAFIYSSFWGLCRHLAHQQRFSQELVPSEIEIMLREMAVSLYDLLLNGAVTVRKASIRIEVSEIECCKDQDVQLPVFQAMIEAGSALPAPGSDFNGTERFLPI